MSTRVDRNLYPELQRFGATDISACFNCGVCSAICPLSVDGASFPRRMSRYAQLGMREKLLSSPELWSCYGCSAVSYTHLRAHETRHDLVCRLLLEKKKTK